jgi:hydroxymethylbilane synthase
LGRLSIATRESRLSRAQTRIVVDMLSSRNSGLEIEVIPIKTLGDRLPPEKRDAVDRKTAFTGDIESLLLSGVVDAAVHSMKDLPVKLKDGLKIAATPPRGDPRDALISLHGEGLRDLPPRAAVGTSSLRRKAQLLNLRRDLSAIDLHGNIQSRIGKMERLRLDAIVLAAAGLERVSEAQRIAQLFSIEEMVPAAVQGTLAVEIRRGDIETEKVVAKIDDERTRLESECERAFARRIGGDCYVPVGACARLNGPSLTVIGMIGSPDGGEVLKRTLTSPAKEAEPLGRKLGEEMLHLGGEKILRSLAH